MTLSFRNFIGSIQIFNTLSKTITGLPRPLVDDITIANNFFIVMCTCVRGSTLARLAVVLVLLSTGNTPALRVITFQAGKPLLYESLIFKQEDLFTTSYYSSSRETSALRVTRGKKETHQDKTGKGKVVRTKKEKGKDRHPLLRSSSTRRTSRLYDQGSVVHTPNSESEFARR